jgi:hypothetical protein
MQQREGCSARLSGAAAEGGDPVSTRKLIVAALVCGLLILVAFAIQVSMATK